AVGRTRQSGRTIRCSKPGPPLCFLELCSPLRWAGLLNVVVSRRGSCPPHLCSESSLTDLEDSHENRCTVSNHSRPNRLGWAAGHSHGGRSAGRKTRTGEGVPRSRRRPEGNPWLPRRRNGEDRQRQASHLRLVRGQEGGSKVVSQRYAPAAD